MKRIIAQFLLPLALMTIPFLLATTSVAYAGINYSCADGTVITISTSQADALDKQCANHGGGGTALNGNQNTTDADTFTTNPAGDCGTGGNDNCINKDIQLVVNFLSAGVGIVITIVIIIAGLQYMTSRDNPQAVQAAKTRITNAVIALIAFVFIYAFLQWVVPGGVF